LEGAGGGMSRSFLSFFPPNQTSKIKHQKSNILKSYILHVLGASLRALEMNNFQCPIFNAQFLDGRIEHWSLNIGHWSF
jgi:hypothetical protein